MLIGTLIACSGCGKAIATDAKNETQNKLETVTRSDCLVKTNIAEHRVQALSVPAPSNGLNRRLPYRRDKVAVSQRTSEVPLDEPVC